jgi:hypothetical protein
MLSSVDAPLAFKSDTVTLYQSSRLLISCYHKNSLIFEERYAAYVQPNPTLLDGYSYLSNNPFWYIEIGLIPICIQDILSPELEKVSQLKTCIGVNANTDTKTRIGQDAERDSIGDSIVTL